MSSWLATGVRYRMPPVAEHCRRGDYPGIIPVAVVASAAAAAAAEVVLVDADIHRVGFQDIDIVACCAGRHRLDPRRAACMCPVERVFRRCHVHRRVLCREACLCLAVGIDVVGFAGASNFAGVGVVHATVAFGFPVESASLFPCSWAVSATSVGAASALEGSAVGGPVAHSLCCFL